MSLDFKGGPFKGRKSFKWTQGEEDEFLIVLSAFPFQASSMSLAACICVSSFWMNYWKDPECVAVRKWRGVSIGELPHMKQLCSLSHSYLKKILNTCTC